jgi:hypothetical protein
MKARLIIFFILISGNVLKAQNLYTSGDNGTFETEGSELDIRNFELNTSTVNFESVERSSFYAHRGSFSLKVISKPMRHSMDFDFPMKGSNYSHKFRSTAYLIRAWVYIPSNENQESGDFRIEMHAHPKETGLVMSVCNNLRTDQNVIPKDTWIQIYKYFTPVMLDEHYLRFYAHRTILFPNDQYANTVFYIDDIELFESVIDDREIVNGFNITVDPTGGLPSSEGVDLPYTYFWLDNGSTTKDRSNLAAGIYTLKISQACAEKSFQYEIGIPSPPCTKNIQPCLGQTVQLEVDCGPPGCSYSWWDSPLKGQGTQLGGGNRLERTFFQTGVFSYFVQVDINGVSSERSQLIVNVSPLPDPEIQPSVSTIFKRKSVTFTANNHQNTYSYVYTITGAGTTSQHPVSTNQFSHTFLIPGNYTVTTHVTDNNNCSSSVSFPINVTDVTPLCSATIPKNQSGTVVLDKFSGVIVYKPESDCLENIPLGCIGGRVDAPLLNNVVSASASTYSDRWKYDHMAVAPSGSNSFEKGERGKWRPSASYAYNNGNVKVDKNYNSGTFPIAHFNWQYPGVTSRAGWLKVNEITKYTPDGETVEEVNALDIASTAKFGYGGALPYLIAQNAVYSSVVFESFEYMNGAFFEDGVPCHNAQARKQVGHSGSYSFAPKNSPFESRSLPAKDNLLIKKGMVARIWVTEIGGLSTDLTNKLSLAVFNTSYLIAQQSFSKIATIGVWSLWEARIEPSNLTGSFSSFHVKISQNGGGDIVIDDVRIQPLDAEMTCYVYDPRTLRLLTVFDDQHFGLYYQYNIEGQLTRKIIETERGKKTIQETQYNLPTTNRQPIGGE